MTFCSFWLVFPPNGIDAALLELRELETEGLVMGSLRPEVDPSLALAFRPDGLTLRSRVSPNRSRCCPMLALDPEREEEVAGIGGES